MHHMRVQAAGGGFAVFRVHIFAGFIHGFDYFVQRHHRLGGALQRHARGVDGFDGGNGVALDARYLHLAAHRVASEAKMVLHGDFGGNTYLFDSAALNLGQPGSGHGAGHAHFALAAYFRTGNGGIHFIQAADGAGRD